MLPGRLHGVIVIIPRPVKAHAHPDGGRVTLTAGKESWEGREGDLLILPDAPHSLTALADSAVLLTVVKRP